MGFSDYLPINVAEGHKQVIPITVFVAVLCLCLVIGHLLQENRWVNESITAIIIVRIFFFFFSESGSCFSVIGFLVCWGIFFFSERDV